MSVDGLRACYRVRFNHDRAYCVEVTAVSFAEWFTAKALLYRVVDGVRDPDPIRRADGTPLALQAENEMAGLVRACDLLEALNGGRPESITLCVNRDGRP